MTTTEELKYIERINKLIYVHVQLGAKAEEEFFAQYEDNPKLGMVKLNNVIDLIHSLVKKNPDNPTVKLATQAMIIGMAVFMHDLTTRKSIYHDAVC